MSAPSGVEEAVLFKSTNVPDSAPVKGYDFNEGVDFDKLMGSYVTSGFQATNLGKAFEEVNKMLDWTLNDEPIPEDEDEEFKDPEMRKKVRTKIWLAYTSNMISCGMREVIKFLVQHKMVQVLVTTAGGIEEDIMKCQSPHILGDFGLKGRNLRGNGINRIGNLLVPNDNYCTFESWMAPLLHEMHDEQDQKGTVWSPSKMIKRMGEKVDHEDSVLYWAAKNGIPVFCPAITDGSVGDMLYFHTYNREGFILDIAGDIRLINDEAMKARKTGVCIIGGGLVKHHTMNANLMRNGADFAMYMTTAMEYDGSDSGANPEEAISWGKVRIDARPVKVVGEASMLFPLLVAQTFAKKFHAGWDRTGVIFDKSYTHAEAEVEREKLSVLKDSKIF